MHLSLAPLVPDFLTMCCSHPPAGTFVGNIAAGYSGGNGRPASAGVVYLNGDAHDTCSNGCGPSSAAITSSTFRQNSSPFSGSGAVYVDDRSSSQFAGGTITENGNVYSGNMCGRSDWTHCVGTRCYYSAHHNGGNCDMRFCHRRYYTGSASPCQ